MVPCSGLQAGPSPQHLGLKLSSALLQGMRLQSSGERFSLGGELNRERGRRPLQRRGAVAAKVTAVGSSAAAIQGILGGYVKQFFHKLLEHRIGNL